MSRLSPHLRRVVAYLRTCGVDGVSVETGGSGHPAVVFSRGAAECRLTVAGTPRNADEQFNYARQALRRRFGVAPEKK